MKKEKQYRLISATEMDVFKDKKKHFINLGYKEAGNYSANIWGGAIIHHQLLLAPTELSLENRDEYEPGHPVHRHKSNMNRLEFDINYRKSDINKSKDILSSDKKLLESLKADLAYYENLTNKEKGKVKYSDRLLIEQYKVRKQKELETPPNKKRGSKCLAENVTQLTMNNLN